MRATTTDSSAFTSGLRIVPDMQICQQDLPLDWYQDEFKPYAEEYLALPDRLPGTVLPWMDRYIGPARRATMAIGAHFQKASMRLEKTTLTGP